MKLFLHSILLVLVVLASAVSAKNPLCLVCSSDFEIPTTWSGTRFLLKQGCDTLGPIASSCNGIVDNADLTSSYPAMYPHLVTIKKVACTKYCV